MANEFFFGPWVGGVTSTSAVIKAGIDRDASAELILSRSATLSDPLRLTPSGIVATHKGQFGLVTVNDAGGATLEVILRGRQLEN